MGSNPTAAAIAAQIRRTRKAFGWSQEELAKQAGVAPGTVSSAEQGKRLRPGNLHAIRTTLGLPESSDEPPGQESPTEGKIRLTLELAEKWLRALKPEQIDQAIQDLTGWIVRRM